MSRQQTIYGMIVVGVVLLVASLLVDAVGIGTEGFGVAQVIGIIVGAALAGAGLYLGFVRQPPEQPE
ncbi:MAG: hypothetical protein JXJ20_00865 [Anaerolineae bacterium]|jgi:hypothetical protein|nr:hypothetical protein [Anaerolineae bacterium]